MGLSPLVPIAGAALGNLAARAVTQISDRLSFVDVLAGDANPADRADAQDKSTHHSPEVQRALEKLQQLVRERFEASGIDTTRPVHLEIDDRGEVKVTTDHADRRVIEDLFQRDQQLADALQELAAALAKFGQPADGLPGVDRLGAFQAVEQSHRGLLVVIADGTVEVKAEE